MNAILHIAWTLECPLRKWDYWRNVKAYYTQQRKITTMNSLFFFRKIYLKMPSTKWRSFCPGSNVLTHWDRGPHICVGNLTIIGLDKGLSPGWRQVIIWTNDGILLIWPLGTKFSEIQIGIQTISYKKMHLNMASVKWRPFCFGLNVLIQWVIGSHDKSMVIARLWYLQCVSNGDTTVLH